MEHKLILGGEQYLPFARSRIKALRATGLVYASQHFSPPGAQVWLQIEPGHEHIRIEGTGAGTVCVFPSVRYPFSVSLDLDGQEVDPTPVFGTKGLRTGNITLTPAAPGSAITSIGTSPFSAKNIAATGSGTAGTELLLHVNGEMKLSLPVIAETFDPIAVSPYHPTSSIYKLLYYRGGNTTGDAAALAVQTRTQDQSASMVSFQSDFVIGTPFVATSEITFAIARGTRHDIYRAEFELDGAGSKISNPDGSLKQVLSARMISDRGTSIGGSSTTNAVGTWIAGGYPSADTTYEDVNNYGTILTGTASSMIATGKVGEVYLAESYYTSSATSTVTGLGRASTAGNWTTQLHQGTRNDTAKLTLTRVPADAASDTAIYEIDTVTTVVTDIFIKPSAPGEEYNNSTIVGPYYFASPNNLFARGIYIGFGKVCLAYGMSPDSVTLAPRPIWMDVINVVTNNGVTTLTKEKTIDLGVLTSTLGSGISKLNGASTLVGKYIWGHHFCYNIETEVAAPIPNATYRNWTIPVFGFLNLYPDYIHVSPKGDVATFYWLNISSETRALLLAHPPSSPSTPLTLPLTDGSIRRYKIKDGVVEEVEFENGNYEMPIIGTALTDYLTAQQGASLTFSKPAGVK